MLMKNFSLDFLKKKIDEFLSGKIQKIKLRSLADKYDFIHVDKAVRLLKLLCEKGETGEIYNIGSGRPILIRDFVKTRLQEKNLDFHQVVEESSEKVNTRNKIVFSCTKKINSLKKTCN